MAAKAIGSASRHIGVVTFLTIAFINAAVDLGHKIIIQNTVFKVYDGNQQVILTAIVNGLILLPFILFFSPAGFLADRFSKPKIMQWSALAAVAITLLITLSYYQGWFLSAFSLTFILALQSAIYSPAKYGYIREIAGEKGIAKVNGLIQATTIAAILSGIFVFSILFEHYLQNHNYQSVQDVISLIAPIGWILVCLSLVEWALTFTLPNFTNGRDQLRFNWQDYRSNKLFKNNVITLSSTPIIWLSILALSLFWGISQTVLAVFPAFAKTTLNETNTVIIQGLLACAGIGIVIGALIAGKLTEQNTANRFIAMGAIGLIISLFLLPHLSTMPSFAFVILCFGLFGGMVLVPLNTFIQHHAPCHQLGTILAGNNWVQNIVMLSFLVVTAVVATFHINSQLILLLLPILTSFIIILLLKISDIKIKLDILH